MSIIEPVVLELPTSDGRTWLLSVGTAMIKDQIVAIVSIQPKAAIYDIRIARKISAIVAPYTKGHHERLPGYGSCTFYNDTRIIDAVSLPVGGYSFRLANKDNAEAVANEILSSWDL